jgi:hypothetical protein
VTRGADRRMRVYIGVRTSIDWSDEASVPERVHPRFRCKLETWDETFALSYARFRSRLCAIARQNLAAVEEAEWGALEDAPPDALLVPVDDDDWFAPDLVHRLRAGHDPGASGYRWRRQVLEPLRPRRGALRFVRPWRRSPTGPSWP